MMTVVVSSRSCITVFRQRTDEKFDFRVWNTELINYAGYQRADGTILGDPMNVTLTEVGKPEWVGEYGPMYINGSFSLKSQLQEIPS